MEKFVTRQIWTPVFSGFSNPPDPISQYIVSGDYCTIEMPFKPGISNSAEFKFTLPFVAVEDTVIEPYRVVNNGVIQYRGVVTVTTGSNIAIVSTPKPTGVIQPTDPLENGWTNTGQKGIEINEFRYRIKN